MTPERYLKEVTAWACSTLTALGIHFEANEDGWDIETPEGWESVWTVGELAQVARVQQMRRMAGR